MKTGDTVPVTVAGQVVAQATIKEMGDGQATLVIPATLVVMATRTELTQETKPEPAKDTIITGVDRPATQEANSGTGNDTGHATGPQVHVEAPVETVVEEKPAASDGPAPTPEAKEQNAGTQENQS